MSDFSLTLVLRFKTNNNHAQALLLDTIKLTLRNNAFSNNWTWLALAATLRRVATSADLSIFIFASTK